ncbi:P-loop containing nucleoside triphosphate hydrolase protein [Byssothecium circinans]|uniref:Structural maintenance of chromosomes protein 5 n=1 Tax=Byssothecium circinans TaxID=147558 RepID=A0A6A5UEV5_9PLEO|nr:P-loop containing nucleoside triphosphate hydrolase protein [Byssothecium circinans]
MPGILNGRKRAAVALSESDNESEASYGSSGSKRARHSRDASDSPAPTVGSHRTQTGDNENAHDDDTHQPGSIVRVKLTNFVTYTAAEFHLGPSLNMIIGPNGTGKSTLVCAICLGLGWSPVNLGRAKDIGEYVKHGQPEAEIEIELAASANQTSNPVIRRIIRKEGNKSSFHIGGRAVPQKEVTALAKSFSIQIDNLCQFLPQDRVVEFAKLEPVDLLRETQRAAAPEHMVEWHNELKELRKSEKTLEVEQQNEDAHLKGLQNKQNATRADVERHNERQELVAKNEMLAKCRPIILARILMGEVKQYKADIRANKVEFLQYQAEVEPAQRAQREMEAYRDQIDQISKSRKRRFEAGQLVVSKFAPKIDKARQSMESFVAEIEAEKQADKQRKQDKKRIEGDITRLQRSIDTPPLEYDAAVFEALLGEIRNKRSAVDRQETELKATLVTIREDVISRRNMLQQKRDARAALDTQAGQQENLLKKLSPDTFKGWQWLEKNKGTLGLKEDVYAPPILSCSVPDAKHAAIVESFIRPKGELITITCTHADDAKVVSDALVGNRANGGMGLHQITIRTVSHPRAFYQPAVTRNELRDMGFDSWIIDHIQGPDPVIAMLCDSAKLHRSAYASTPIPSHRFDTLPQTGIMKCVNGTEVCTIRTRAEYAGASSTSITQLGPARYFTDQPMNTEEKSQLDQDITELERDLIHQRGEHEKLKAQWQALRDQLNKLDEDKMDVKKEQEAVQKTFAEWQGLPRKKAGKEEELKNVERLSADTYHRIRQIQNKVEKTSLEVAAFTLQHAREITKLRALYEAYVEAEIRLIEANSEVEGFVSDNSLIDRALEERRQRLAVLTSQKDAATKKAKEQRAIASEILHNITLEEEDEMKKYSEMTTEELDLEINDITARLDMLSDDNPGAVKAYEKREREIRMAQEKLARNAEQLESAREKIVEIRGQWEPELDELVSRISDGFANNFHKIGCAGQVGVYKDEDFEKWAIQIQVRFREDEPLQILDSHRQSGGERAVSTIFYLMALQDLARSPFRVVDEINQGMDPRNERMVHERMVDIACRERTSQYFLITPKLLNDLKFHPKMKVHCIASGEHMPDQKTNLDFQKLARVALRVRKGIVAAA